MDINKKGNYFITGGKDGLVKLWNFSNLKAPAKVWEFGETINDIKFSPSENYFAVATDTHTYLLNENSDDST